MYVYIRDCKWLVNLSHLNASVCVYEFLQNILLQKLKTAVFHFYCFYVAVFNYLRPFTIANNKNQYVWIFIVFGISLCLSLSFYLVVLYFGTYFYYFFFWKVNTKWCILCIKIKKLFYFVPVINITI